MSWDVVEAKKYREPLKRNLAISWQITLDDGPKHSTGVIYSLGACECWAARSWRNVLGKHLHVPPSIQLFPLASSLIAVRDRRLNERDLCSFG